MKYKGLAILCLLAALYIEFIQYGFLTALFCFFSAIFALSIGPHVWKFYKKLSGN